MIKLKHVALIASGVGLVAELISTCVDRKSERAEMKEYIDAQFEERGFTSKDVKEEEIRETSEEEA